jgi:hypothetical protein
VIKKWKFYEQMASFEVGSNGSSDKKEEVKN